MATKFNFTDVNIEMFCNIDFSTNNSLAGMIIKWVTSDIGFGEIIITQTKEETLIESECMNNEFVMQAFRWWLDNKSGNEPKTDQV